MDPEAELVLAIAREAVYAKKDARIPFLIKNGNINWARFKNILAYHDLLPFAHLSLKKYFYSLPEETVDTLKATFFYYLKFSTYLEQEFLDLANSFSSNGITLVPIKGVAFLEDLYPDFPVRASTDIDALVQEEDLGRSIALLEDLGFKRNLEGLKESYWREKNYHFVFTKEGPPPFSLMLELHWDLDYPRKEKLLPEKFRRLRELRISDRKIKLLSPEDTFLALALHQRRFGKTLALRNACDIARLLNKYSLSFDWDYLLGESKSSRLSSVIFFALYQIQHLFGVNVPKRILKELRLPVYRKYLIRNFIEKNTFLASQKFHTKSSYLKAHFLLFDSLLEPIAYIFNIPQEQFANFYGFKPYDKKTEFLYKSRLLYIPFQAIAGLIAEGDK